MKALEQRKGEHGKGQGRVSDATRAASAGLRSPAMPLDTGTRAFFEPRFGYDFSQVRLHSGEEAARSTRELGARAFTVGQDIVLGEGAYKPGTSGGIRLLAHELTHVVQQGLAAAPGREMGARHDSDEAQAERSAAALDWGGLSHRYNAVAPAVTWHATARPLPGVPVLSPAGALIQRVQLTYDDGPDSAGNTRTVLNALNTAGARATFYVVGKKVAQGDNWRTVFDIAAAGHWLGNHAYDWNDATDNHIFLSGTAEDRAQKILQTEWAIRDALIQGRDDAKKKNAWTTIPQANRDYIEDVIAHGTGRFRTPGFKSKAWSGDGGTSLAALDSANKVLTATGLRPLEITKVTSLLVVGHEGVTVDPEDWRSGRTQSDIESGVKNKLSSNDDSILLHSRIGATASATPAIVKDIKSRGWSFDPTVQGKMGAGLPAAGFAGLSTISDPPTPAEIAAARAYLKSKMLMFGPYLSGSLALGIFQLAQRAGNAEVMAFAAEIKATTVQTPQGAVPMANWMQVNQEWRLFTSFFESWVTQKPFPKIKGVTI